MRPRERTTAPICVPCWTQRICATVRQAQISALHLFANGRLLTSTCFERWPSMPLIGYARVSTDDQTPLPQAQALRAAGCSVIREEHGSGGNRARPVLTSVLNGIRKGDTLVVVRIDRLARSLSHLLEIIEQLEAKGAFFRSIEDPIDTASPQGKFTLQVLGAAAEFERALIRERTKAGLASARL